VTAALPVLQVVGTKKAGKTAAATALVAEFTRRGYLVGAVKHSHHAVPPDDAGTDSQRLAAAGALLTALCGGDGTVVRGAAASSLATALDPLCGRVDVAVVESFSTESAGAVLRVEREAVARAELRGPDGACWFVGAPDDIGAIADAFEQRAGLTATGSGELRALIRRAAQQHGHACPGITLGVRLGLYALRLLGPAAQPGGVAVTVEDARCAVDGIAAATGARLSGGTLRVIERGTLAATVTSLVDGRAVRLSALESARNEARRWAPRAADDRGAQSVAYRLMPDESLFTVEWVDERPERSNGRAALAGAVGA
jgi:molybdopterin-guanine dinucleotide biosynthesis protein MobB